MDGDVTVVDRLYERQGIKVVVGPDGASHVPPGSLPEPGTDLLAVMGEPAFTVRFANELANDEELPDDVRAALDRACERLLTLDLDGTEDKDREQHVEWVLGPTVHDGAVRIRLDTDDKGFTKALVDTAAAILVEELTPLGVTAVIGTA